MPDARFTFGPWVWRYGGLRGQDGSEVLGAAQDGAAQRRWVTCENPFNRRLIAAAPEMYALLKEWLNGNEMPRTLDLLARIDGAP